MQETPSRPVETEPVLDEAHDIRNDGSKTSVALSNIKAVRKIALTGTPIQKDTSDLFSLLRWIEPQEYCTFFEFSVLIVSTSYRP
jgi:chromodomain-helicase-DNA-binding protein 7